MRHKDTEELVAKAMLSIDWYATLARLVDYLHPKQIVELGAQEGHSTKAMLERMDKDAILYSVDILPNWVAVPDDPRLVKISGDDIEMSIWKPYKVDLCKTDLWEIDSDHSYEHISKQWELYSPFFKKGTVIAIDDVDSNFVGVQKFWDELVAGKVQINRCGIVLI